MGIFSFLFNRKKTNKSHKQDWLDVKEEVEKREEEVAIRTSLSM